MKVKVSFTIEVDENEWMETYGVEKTQVREDVKAYIYHGSHDQLAGLGLLKEEDS